MHLRRVHILNTSACIHTSGGFSNASTDSEYTTYHFEVNLAHLSEALDRFAQFFVAPLFKAGEYTYVSATCVLGRVDVSYGIYERWLLHVGCVMCHHVLPCM